jgi:hypothetical protein
MTALCQQTIEDAIYFNRPIYCGLMVVATVNIYYIYLTNIYPQFLRNALYP